MAQRYGGHGKGEVAYRHTYMAFFMQKKRIVSDSMLILKQTSYKYASAATPLAVMDRSFPESKNLSRQQHVCQKCKTARKVSHTKVLYASPAMGLTSLCVTTMLSPRWPGNDRHTASKNTDIFCTIFLTLRKSAICTLDPQSYQTVQYLGCSSTRVGELTS